MNNKFSAGFTKEFSSRNTLIENNWSIWTNMNITWTSLKNMFTKKKRNCPVDISYLQKLIIGLSGKVNNFRTCICFWSSVLKLQSTAKLQNLTSKQLPKTEHWFAIIYSLICSNVFSLFVDTSRIPFCRYY